MVNFSIKIRKHLDVALNGIKKLFSTQVVYYLAAIATILSLFVAIISLLGNPQKEQSEKNKAVDNMSTIPVFKEEQRLLEGVYERNE